MPDDFTEEKKRTIEDAESRAFQISLYNEILRSTRSGKKPIYINLQHYDKTTYLLENAGISIRDAWKENPEKLAEILEVDAVVKARIEKQRFMSDLASFGIDLGIEIMNVLTNNTLFPWLPFGATRSKEIRADFSLLDKDNGNTLWSISFDQGADWHSPSNEIIDNITRRAARNFPYRR